MANHKLSPETKYYYVDESGDPTIFGKKHKVMLGQPGVSDFFLLGLMSTTDPEDLTNELSKLRRDLIRDPYFKGVPSFQPEEKKTYVAFHAKDDLPEVRKAVFDLLSARKDLRFYAVIKNKHVVKDYVLNHNQSDPAYHYSGNELYDFCVRRLFRDRLHKNAHYEITFAERLRKDRTKAMVMQLEAARERFYQKYGISSDVDIQVCTTTPVKEVALQAVDYYLWALSRFYIHHESRYLDYIASSVKLIVDIDDTREYPYGKYYTPDGPITTDQLPPLK